MPVYLDVESRFDVRAAERAAREAVQIWTRAGNDISRGLGSNVAKAFGAIDGSVIRKELQSIEAEYIRLRDAEMEAARVATRSAAEVEAAHRRVAEVTAKYTAESSQAAIAQAKLADAQARAARDMRVNADAIVATEGAHRALTDATEKGGAAASRAGQLFNAAGVVGAAGFGAALFETTRKAGDFQQQMTKLGAAASVPASQLKTISDGVLKMAGEVGYSTTDLSNSMFTISKMGYNAADGLKVLSAAAQGANAEQADLGEVVKALTLTMHNFGVEPDKAAETMSKMVAAVGESGGSLQDFAGALHTVEPVANQLHLKLEDVWGTLAQMSKSGESFDQAADNMLNAMRSLSGAQGPARDAMQQLGLNADEVSQNLSTRGLAGTMQYLSDTVMQHFADQNHVAVGEMRNAAQAQANLGEMFAKMSPYARQHAEALANNSEGSRAYTMAMRGANEQDKVQMEQARQLIDRVDGFSKRFANGRETLETYTQAMNELLGTTAGAQVAFQITGDKAADTNQVIQEIATTYTNADGTVKGFHETQDTLNAKMRDAKAAFGAAEAEIGSMFVPIMTEAAKGAKWVGDELSRHPAIAQDVTVGLGVMGGAWLTIKGYNIASTILSPIASGLGTVIGKLRDTETAAITASGSMRGMGDAAMEGEAGVLTAAEAEVAAEGRVATAASEANAAIAGGKGGAGLAAAAGPIGISAVGSMGADSVFSSLDRRFHTDVFTKFGEIPGSGAWLAHQLGMAHGGEVHGPGPKGHDSVPAWLAPGEHVLTHHDVARMGGHKAVHAFRNALHRQYGGEVGPDVAVAESMVGQAYNQAVRNDCSGSVAKVVAGALGLPVTNLPTTQNMGQWLAQLGFRNGIGGPGTISVGWYNHGSAPNDGHAAMTLSNGENAESGGSHGNFIVGAGAAGASNPEFDHHMYLPTLYGEGPGGGMPGGFGGMSGFGGGGGGFGGGIPAGATAGTGPGGQPGYYMPNQEKIAADQERLRHLDAEIADAEKRKTEMKSDAKQSERDRVDEEIRHLKEERNLEQQRLQEAERGSFHALRGGRGRGGGENPFLPVPLANNFGLSKGLPGLVEWGIGALEDMVLGPLETAAMASIGESTDILQPGGGSGFGGGLGIPPGPGQFGLGAPGLTAAAFAGGGGPPGADSPGAEGNDWRSAGAPPAAPGGPTGGSGVGSGPTQFSHWWKSVADQSQSEQRDMLRQAFTAPPNPGWYGSPWFNPEPPLSVPFSGKPGAVSGSGQANKPQSGLGAIGDLLDSVGGWYDRNLVTHGGSPYPIWQPPTGFGGSTGHGSGPGIKVPGEVTNTAPFAGAAHFAQGGPVGTDTVPAWLTPGEFVVNAQSANQFLPQLQAMNKPQYLEPGGPVQPSQPAPPPQQPSARGALPNVGSPGSPKDKGSGTSMRDMAVPGAPQPPSPGAPGGMPVGGGAESPGDQKAMAGAPKPGAGVQQPGENLPASPGIGFSGGIIGGLEGAATSAAAMGADMGTFGAGGGAASAAMQIGFQELNRAAAYGAQAAGIAAKGLLEAFTVDSSSTGGDWAETIPGRLLSGIAGVRPSQNTAGQTQTPLAGNQNGGYADASGGDNHFNFNAPVHVHANNPAELTDAMQQFNNSYTLAENTHPMSGSMFTGRS